MAWETVAQKVGGAEMKRVPFGAITLYAYADKIGANGYGADANEAVLVTEKLLA